MQGKAKEKLKKEWKEKRQGTLISIGSKHKTHKGNLCLRFEEEDGKLKLRITTGNREFIYAKVKREPSGEKDKWNTFLSMLLESFKSERYFPYTVELKLREGDIYGNVSFEIPTPEIWLTKKYGVIAIDTNASPLHLAVAEVSPDGNLLRYQSISLHEFLNYPKNRKENEEWLLAHRIVKIAKEKGKAIAIEDLKKVKRGKRGDGKAKLRKRLHSWNFKSLLSKIERVAKLNGIEVIKVNPACQRGRQAGSAWRVLRVALVLPLLGRAFTRDFSFLKPLLVEGRCKRLTAGLVPSGFGGTMPRGNTG